MMLLMVDCRDNTKLITVCLSSNSHHGIRLILAYGCTEKDLKNGEGTFLHNLVIQ